jgi:hypothetical protein
MCGGPACCEFPTGHVGPHRAPIMPIAPNAPLSNRVVRWGGEMPHPLVADPNVLPVAAA